MDKTDTSWRDGFAVAGPDSIAKAMEIIDGGVEKLACIFDWDGVITPNDPNSMGGTNWAVLKRNMSAASLEQHKALYRQFRPLEEEGKLTLDEAEQWQRQAMELLIGASVSDIEEDARTHNGRLRAGINDFFTVLQAADIPVFIKSAGERHIIEAVSKQHGLTPTRIFSNEFSVNSQGIITGVHEHTITHSLNKHTFSHRATDGHQARSTAIVVGDNPHDARMVSEDVSDVILKIRVDVGHDTYLQSHSQAEWQNYLERSFEAGYDLVATDDSVESLCALTKLIIASQQN